MSDSQRQPVSEEEVASARVAEQVMASRRYRGVDATLVRRLAADELRRRRTEAEAVKQVKRRLHQAIGAYRPAMRRAGTTTDPLAAVRAAWHGDLADPAFRAACREILATHASTRERLPSLDVFYARIWEATGGPPSSLLDLGCGVGPLALPWMGLPDATSVHAVDVDAAQLTMVGAFLALVGQPHMVEAMDLAAHAPSAAAEVGLLLKLVPLLDRQDPAAATRLLAALRVERAVISFPRRSLGGRGKGMETRYRRRMATLAADLGPRVIDVREASVSNELVFVAILQPAGNG